MTRFQQGDAFDARHARQADIDEGHVGDVGADPGQRLFHGTVGAGAAIAVSAVDQHLKPFADFAAVFDDRDLRRTGAAVGGRERLFAPWFITHREFRHRSARTA